MFRAGLYARISANDQQTLAMQNRAMREYGVHNGMGPVGRLLRGGATSERLAECQRGGAFRRSRRCHSRSTVLRSE
jgi:DNA invertase Pin-like site-specific DNA recombinase